MCHERNLRSYILCGITVNFIHIWYSILWNNVICMPCCALVKIGNVAHVLNVLKTPAESENATNIDPVWNFNQLWRTETVLGENDILGSSCLKKCQPEVLPTFLRLCDIKPLTWCGLIYGQICVWQVSYRKFLVRLYNISGLYGLVMGFLAWLHLDAKIRAMARPNSPLISPKRKGRIVIGHNKVP